MQSEKKIVSGPFSQARSIGETSNPAGVKVETYVIDLDLEIEVDAHACTQEGEGGSETVNITSYVHLILTNVHNQLIIKTHFSSI